MTPKNSKPGTGSVTLRALNLLTTFTPAKPTLSLTEIAKLSDLPLSTTHRLVADLLQWGALERNASGKLHIGIRLREISSIAPRGLLLRELALPALEDLAHVTGETAMLGISEESDIIYLERVTGKLGAQDALRMKTRFPLISSAGGRLLLAFSPSKSLHFEKSFPKYTDHTITDPEELRRQLAEIRHTGIAISNRETANDFVAVSAPIKRLDSPQVVAVLTLGGAHHRVDIQTLSALARTAAMNISRIITPELVTGQFEA